MKLLCQKNKVKSRGIKIFPLSSLTSRFCGQPLRNPSIFKIGRGGVLHLLRFTCCATRPQKKGLRSTPRLLPCRSRVLAWQTAAERWYFGTPGWWEMRGIPRRRSSE